VNNGVADQLGDTVWAISAWLEFPFCGQGREAGAPVA